MFSGLNWRVGFFLAWRQLWRMSLWTNGLIIFVMILTFLNLVVISGVLVGLIEGAVQAVRTEYTSDVIVSTLKDKDYIDNSQNLINLIRTWPQVSRITARYRAGAILEANYKTRRDKDTPNTAAAQMIGIDPIAENEVTGLASHIVEGHYLAPGDYDKVIIGHFLLKQYLPIESPGFTTLENVGIGSKIRIQIGDVQREVEIKGILKSKVDEVSRSIYMLDSQFRSLIGRNDGNVDEVAIKLNDGVDPLAIKDLLFERGMNNYAKIQTYVDAQPKFLQDIKATFALLGNVISSIGLVVASITIFIVIFINALTRRKFIGILKGIGLTREAIELSYIFQSFFYALVGSAVGLLILYLILVPTIAAHPINFPFSDGILVAPVKETIFRIGLLVLATIVAGYIPARMIVRQNTLDSILGRK